MLSTAIRSKEHGGRVRGLSSKLSIKDGFEKDKARYRSHDRYKEEIVAAAENAMQAKFKNMLRAAAAARANCVQPVARGWTATDGGSGPSSNWPSEFGMCSE